ncbi:hypothetical protein ACF09L_28390 [Streptomyces sp. NPDC014779]|uniref:hypothetical protein n=1 Tax=Streptomyces sp. NPDC014779 TaxID=3364911 RepID=UPI0036F7EB4C
MAKTDRDAVVRAQVLLLGTEEPELLERIAAYRALAEVGPLTYLPKLSGALCELADAPVLEDRPELRLRYFSEALEIARRLGEDEPARDALVREARSGCERVAADAG